MLEQQLVDYIKKAREASQSDEQTRALLYKSGWTETEVSEAVASLEQPKRAEITQPEVAVQQSVEAKPQEVIQSNVEAVVQPQVEIQPRVEIQPEPEVKPQIQPRVQPQAQYSQANQQNDMPQMRAKSHTALKLLMVLIIIVVLGGAGYFVAGQYINLPWNPFKPSPETVIGKMIANMKDVKSSHTVMQGEIDASDSNKTPIGKISFNGVGESDIINAASPKGDSTFSINVAMQGSASAIASINLSVAVVGDASYVKINDITIPGTISYPGLDIAKIKGNWIKIDKDSIAALKALSSAQTSQLGGASNITTADSVALMKKVQDIFVSENLLAVSKQLSDEVVSGQDTYHYLLTISKDKLKDLMNKIIALEAQEAAKLQTQGGTSSNSNLLTQNMIQAFVNTFVDTIGDINVEVWIGKNDYMLYQTKIDQAIDLSKIYPSANVQLEFKINTTSSNFNKPITVQVPANSQKIEDLLSPLLKTQKINADMTQIGVIAQSVSAANKSYSSLCSRGLLNGYLATYGKDLVQLHGDIVSQGAGKPVCFAGAQSYCVSTQLADGNYVCIDGNGVLGSVNCISSKTICSPSSQIVY